MRTCVHICMYVCMCVSVRSDTRSPSDHALHKEGAGGKQNDRRKQSRGRLKALSAPRTRSPHWDNCSLPGSAARKMCTWWRGGSSRAGRGRCGPEALAGDPLCGHGRPASRGVRAPVRSPPRLTAPHLSAPALASPCLSSPQRTALCPLTSHLPAQPPHRSGGKGQTLASEHSVVQTGAGLLAGGGHKHKYPLQKMLPQAPISGVLEDCGCPPGWRQRLLRVRQSWAPSAVRVWVRAG